MNTPLHTASPTVPAAPAAIGRTGQRTSGSEAFRDSEGLRTLLRRLQADDGSAWRTDREAAELMRFVAERYAALARKHGLDPWEAAAAAFDAMRAPSALRADDPWAIVTRAVQVTCIAEERAHGLLCAVHQARRPRLSGYHDAERFSDREHPLPDYHPAFHTSPVEEPDEPPLGVQSAVENAIELFRLLGWPPDRARDGVEYICSRLADAASRPSAYESLRRDYAARALLDLPQRAWMTMLRTLLGCGDPLQAHTAAGRGILLRLIVGEPLDVLLRDDELVSDIVANVPGVGP
ncbi:hypothetical protein [Microterricola viridarii]|uniref:Serine/arginine repetitive matrix protein 2 n=1 Tax=Microterricola viridarii TaxID=412690 RepID=A0A1H1VFZ7_9MICO|nr:hypothetical protein [Microterricola viridarii]SDS83737.1 hypothetical protein SAMN04489834_2256 [Microterricola viridarii]